MTITPEQTAAAAQQARQRMKRDALETAYCAEMSVLFQVYFVGYSGAPSELAAATQRFNKGLRALDEAYAKAIEVVAI